MGGEIVTESWFSYLPRATRKSIPLEAEKDVIGILAFEVVNMMSKVVTLWQCLSDKQIVRLRRERIVNSLGTQKLVSEDDEYLMDLALAEIIEKLVNVRKSVARLGKRCADPVYHSLEHVFDDLFQIHPKWHGWEYRLKKMVRKVKHMERFIMGTAQLYQEMEVLAELEKNIRKMKVSAHVSRAKLPEFRQKVVWQRQLVKNLRGMSPWVRTYDYTVRLLLRSLFTIVERIKRVFGINQLESMEAYNNCDSLLRSHSTSARMQSSVHPSEDELSELYSGSLRVGGSLSNLGVSADKIRTNCTQFQAHQQSFTLCEKPPRLQTRRLAHVVPFKRCMRGGSDSPIPKPGVSSNKVSKLKDTNVVPLSCRKMIHCKESLFNSRCNLLNGPPTSLGGSALALHYANVIILIEKLALSPDLISLDARDDLYNSLTFGIRTSLRFKLKLFAKPLASSVYDPATAAESSLAVARILEWLAPLAHNTIRWYSERNFEKQCMVTRTNVLLVQTLYFANKAKTEAAITELLMGMNYLTRFGR